MNLYLVLFAVAAAGIFVGWAFTRKRFPLVNPPMSWDRFWLHLDKFVAVFLFLATLTAALHIMHDRGDSPSVQWIQGIVGQLLSLLAGLMGGAAFARGAAKPPEVTPPPTPQGDKQ